MVAVVFILTHGLIALQMWTSAPNGRMRSCPVTTIVITTSAATTAPAALATSSIQTTGPAEVGPRDHTTCHHFVPCFPIRLGEAPRRDRYGVGTIRNEARELGLRYHMDEDAEMPTSWKVWVQGPKDHIWEALTSRPSFFLSSRNLCSPTAGNKPGQVMGKPGFPGPLALSHELGLTQQFLFSSLPWPPKFLCDQKNLSPKERCGKRETKRDSKKMPHSFSLHLPV